MISFDGELLTWSSDKNRGKFNLYLSKWLQKSPLNYHFYHSELKYFSIFENLFSISIISEFFNYLINKILKFFNL